MVIPPTTFFLLGASAAVGFLLVSRPGTAAGPLPGATPLRALATWLLGAAVGLRMAALRSDSLPPLLRFAAFAAIGGVAAWLALPALRDRLAAPADPSTD
jgi:hypothetical protein